MNTGRTATWLVVTLLAIAAAAVLFLQRQQTLVLHTEAAIAREQAGTLVAVRAENDRLKAALPPPAELARLRAEQAELDRLQAEMAALRQKLPNATRR